MPVMVGRALRLRCILCGSNGVFRGWRMAERCPRCNLKFEREQGQFVGAVGINTIVSFGAILIALILGFVITWPDPQPIPILIEVVAVALIVPALFFPMSKGIWGTFDLLTEPLHEGEARPGPWSEPIALGDD